MRIARLSRLACNRSGNVSMIVALGATVLIGAVAFAVDEGKLFTDRRVAQSTVDLSALAAAGSPANASFVAGETVRRNGVKLTAPLTVQTGTYDANPLVAVGDRFKLGPAATADAVRVTLRTSGETYFSRFLGAADELPIQTTATATTTAMASFSIGSRLAALNGGILNQLLGKALGCELSLTLMDYRSLADLRVDTFGFLNAVAGEARISGPTYTSILDADVRTGHALDALSKIAAADGSSDPVAVRLLELIARDSHSAAKINLGDQIDLGPYENLPTGQRPAASIVLSALDILMVAARLADGEHQVAADMIVDVPGLASADLRVVIGERPVASGWTAVGRRGASVQTAQTRLFLDLKIAPAGMATVLQIPVYVDIAKSQATLASVSCPAPGRPGSVGLDVTPGIVEAWIANIPRQGWEAMAGIYSPSAATIASLGPLKVAARAHVEMANVSPRNITFSMDDIADRRVKTVSTSDYLSSLFAALVGDLELGIGIAGTGVMLPGQQKVLKDAMVAVAAPVDSILFTTLAYLGVGLGQADVVVHGVRCDVAVLVH